MNDRITAMHKIIYIAKTHHSVIDSKMTDVGMHRSTHMMLMLLSRFALPPSQKEIAETLKISAAAVAATLERLEADGYIEKIASENDRRANSVKITPKGREVLSKTQTLFSETDSVTFSGIDGDDFDKFCEYLDVVAKNLTDMKEKIAQGGNDR